MIGISVALCTHNGAEFITAQVESILRQSHPVDEIVLSDDASVDDTVNTVERLVETRRATGIATPTLVVIRNSTALGVTANFEQALSATTGDLIALADQDDIWCDDRIARAVREMGTRPNTELVASNANLIDAGGVPLGTSLFETLGLDTAAVTRLRESPLAELLRRNLLTGATMLVARGLVERARPFPSSWVHDEWLAVVAAAVDGISIVDEPLIDYRQHAANQIGVTKLGLSGKVLRLRVPRGERNARLRARAFDLAHRLPPLTANPVPVAQVLDAKLAHEDARSELPAARLRRIRPLVQEMRTGRYTTFGLGMQDVLRDLVQPE